MVHTLNARGDMGIDLDGFESSERASTYAVEQEPRIESARGEYSDTHAKRDARELGNRVRTAITAGALTREQITEIDRLLTQVEARHSAAA